MKQFYLTEITTKDNLMHQGVFYKPKHPGKRAILWVHGLTDNFYGDIKTLEEFVIYCEREEWGFGSFNTRGHDIVSSVSKIDPKSPKGKTSITQGSAIEKFTDCIYDIEAAINFLEKQGFSQIVLIGISTGANKVCYYIGKRNDPQVIGVVLASAISDVGIKMKELGKRYRQTVVRVKKLGRFNGDEVINGLDYMPITPNRFLSAYDINREEDVFPYYQKSPKFSTYSKITKPLMVIMGSKDEYADIPVSQITDIYEKFNRSKNFHRAIVQGAFHSFGGKEKEFVRAIFSWLKTL